MSVGQELKRLRARHGLTQNQLSIAIWGGRGHQSMISRIEGGKCNPELGTLEALARFFGVPLSRFGVSPGEEVSEADIEEADQLLAQAQDMMERAMEILERAKI